ncbi:hypothetical protein [Flavobacterium sp.]|uniref:hypothetical protein n=1 Tax=Flavobacterium sp. TaxID=239 RepID=UPI00260B4318|nr:hypothetical protein [Flavobacterium sp.]MDG2431726.1 hypothetical protein [Flavobacterium sp.]
MKKSNLFRLTTLALMSLSFLSCKQDPNRNLKSADSINEGKSILIESNVQKKEWEKFQITLDSTINANDIRIAEFKLKAKQGKKEIDSTTRYHINVLEEKNQIIKSKLNTFTNKTTKDWNNFKTEINQDLKDFEFSIKQFDTDK